MAPEATDEDVLYQNNIVVFFLLQSPIFHNKAIFSYIYSLVSEHPHPPLARTPKRALLFRGTPTGPPSPTWRRLIWSSLQLPRDVDFSIGEETSAMTEKLRAITVPPQTHHASYPFSRTRYVSPALLPREIYGAFVRSRRLKDQMQQALQPHAPSRTA